MGAAGVLRVNELMKRIFQPFDAEHGGERLAISEHAVYIYCALWDGKGLAWQVPA